MTEVRRSVSEANARGFSALVRDAEQGITTVITRHGTDVAAIMPLDLYERLTSLAEPVTVPKAALQRLLAETRAPVALGQITAKTAWHVLADACGMAADDLDGNPT